MNCYLCETGEHPGGTLYHLRPAVGVCQECGIGVCREHGAKADGARGRLLCADCARSSPKTTHRAA